MITLDDLVGVADRRLRVVVRPLGPGEVAGVWPADDSDCPVPHRPDGWRAMLAVVSGRPLDARRVRVVVEDLAKRGAAGIVIAESSGAGVVAAARRVGMPVLSASPVACSVPYLAQVVADLRSSEHEEAVAQLRHLIDRAEQLGDPASAVPLLEWLGQRIDGQAYLIAPHQQPPTGLDGLVLPADRIAAVADANADTDAVDEGRWTVRLYGLGNPTPPRSVLAVARRGGWPTMVNEAVHPTQRVLSTWLRSASDVEFHRAPFRASLLEMLLAGHAEAARRAASPMRVSPGLLAEDVQAGVYVVRVRSPHRKSLMVAFHQQLGDLALVVPSDSDPGHIVIVAVDSDEVRGELRKVLAASQGLYLGAGLPGNLGEVRSGYEQALEALAAATDEPDGWADYDPIATLASALPSGPAHSWARARLAALDDWSSEKRTKWVEATRVALALGPVAAAHALGTNRNTIRNRYNGICAAVGLDAEDPTERIVLDVALRITRLRRRAPQHKSQTLADLLGTEEAASWARAFLARFPQPLLDVLIAWLDTGQDTEQTAQRTGLHAKTVRTRLHTAERILQRRLYVHSSFDDSRTAATSVNAIHDLVLAAHITGILTNASLGKH